MLLSDRNIIGPCSEIFGYLWKSSENFRKMFGNVRLAFGTILENLRKVVGNFRKIIKKPLSLECLCNEQNITCWLLDMNFIFSCSTRYFTCSLHSLARYRSVHSRIKLISKHGHVLSSKAKSLDNAI